MKTIFIELGVFCVAQISAILFQTYSEKRNTPDNRLFCRLLLAAIAIFVMDTLGWVIDGHPICGQVWITTVVDGLDLIFTTTVGWCWVQYALYIARGEQQLLRKWYQNPATLLLILQIVLVSCSQAFGFYYSVDAKGVYHREAGSIGHTLISLAMLAYSTSACLYAAKKESDPKRKNDNKFIAVIIIIPIIGNAIQLLVYGYPTVWLCMCFMIFIVYIHIQNKRVSDEREKQNQKLTVALEQANIANNTKSNFLSRMSHELRTPLNALEGYTELTRENILSEKPDVNLQLHNIDHIHDASKHLLRSIDDILDIQSMEFHKTQLKKAPVDAESYIGSIRDEIAKEAENKGIQFVVECQTRLSETYMLDEVRFRQVIMNVLRNAVKFTPKGGAVHMTVETTALEKNMERITVVVSDTGIGMSQEFIDEKLFSNFAQENQGVKSPYEGCGIGLALSKQLVELMGGTISCTSEKGKGSTFTITINAEIVVEKNQRKKRKLDMQSYDLAGAKVLLCEDNPMNQDMEKRVLEKMHGEVDIADDGQIGLQMFKENEVGYYNIILMDIRMPNMDGWEAARKIRKLDREDATTIPILAVSANAFEEDIQTSLEAGINEHLSKPVNARVLYEKITQYIRK